MEENDRVREMEKEGERRRERLRVVRECASV